MKKYRISLTFEMEHMDTDAAIVTVNSMWSGLQRDWNHMRLYLKEQSVTELEEEE